MARGRSNSIVAYEWTGMNQAYSHEIRRRCESKHCMARVIERRSDLDIVCIEPGYDPPCSIWVVTIRSNSNATCLVRSFKSCHCRYHFSGTDAPVYKLYIHSIRLREYRVASCSCVDIFLRSSTSFC